MAYQNQSSVYVPAVHQLFCMTRHADFNQSEWRRLASHAWLMYFGSASCVAKREFAHLALLIKN